MKRRSNFTLGELAIIISIIAVFALVFSGCGKAGGIFAFRERSHRTSCTNNLKQIGTALELYSYRNDSRIPGGPAPVAGGRVDAADFYTADGRAGGFELLRYNDDLTDYKVYVCPSTSVSVGKGTDSLSLSNVGSGSGKATTSYAYKPAMVKGDSTETGKPASGVCADLTGDAGVDANGGKPNHTKFGNILFLDGHVRGYDGLGWFSPERAGYPMYKVGTRIMIPNTLRDPLTGRASW